MNMTITFKDGSFALIMQQDNGNYVMILRDGETHKVLGVQVEMQHVAIKMYQDDAVRFGATVKMEYAV